MTRTRMNKLVEQAANTACINSCSNDIKEMVLANTVKSMVGGEATLAEINAAVEATVEEYEAIANNNNCIG